jgi:apolipoprotein N-acyltransferase
VSQAESHETQPARTWADPLAGLFAAMALFFSLLALAFHPLTISVAAFLLGFISLLMSSRHEKLAGIALGVAGVCFVAGMTIAVITEKPLW